MRVTLMMLAFSIAASSANAATTPPAFGCPASMAEYHQFDFWIGQWEVRNPKGAVVGHSRIEPISDGCGISERWDGMAGSRGVSYNAWDTSSKHWHQFWVGNAPDGVLHLEGGLDHGKMTMQATQSNPQTGKAQVQRITWTPNADGSVRQLWDQSDDGGKSWTVSFDGLYRKENK
jgi:hypothetical protein